MNASSSPDSQALSFRDLLLPAEHVDLRKWAVIACDQFTADPSYWTSVETFVGNAPSTLHMIIPEIYLDSGDTETRLARIEETMRAYRDGDTLRTIPSSGVYVRRTLPDGTLRRGVVVTVDLEQYDYDPAGTAQVRASEETIPARLPARMDVRRRAPLESPHVLVLFDDEDDTVMNGLEEARAGLERLYATELMEGGGRVEGYRIPEDSTAARRFLADIDALDTQNTYGFRFATGDGNHSLAAAKALWEERKAQGAHDDDPLRWCLVEVVNVYDPGLPFHPIHRLVTGREDTVLDALLKSGDARFHGFPVDRIAGHIAYEGLGHNEIAFIGPHQAGILTLPDDADMAVAVAEQALASVDVEAIDYVHGFEEVVSTAEEMNAVAIVLPEIDRTALFATVANRGALPRKAFSLGQARDKRYYLECRRL